MKILLTFLTIALFSFGVNAGIVTVEYMYKLCKPFQNNGFSMENMTSSQKVNSVICVTFFRTIIDDGLMDCFTMKTLYREKLMSMNDLNALSLTAANNPAQPNSVIVSFINWAEKNPDKFGRLAISYKSIYLHRVFKCDYTTKGVH